MEMNAPTINTRFARLTPMLQTLDMDATIAWYASVLGFECVARMGDEWCHLARDGAELMFMTNGHLGEPGASATFYVHVDDVMALWEGVREHCAPEWGPQRYEYGMLEFAIRDPNGYLLSFGQPVD